MPINISNDIELNRFQAGYRGSKFLSELINNYYFPLSILDDFKVKNIIYPHAPLRLWKYQLDKLSLGFTSHFRAFDKCNMKLQRFVQYIFESNLGKLKKHLKWSLIKVVITVFPVTPVNHVGHVTYAKVVTQRPCVSHVYHVLLIVPVLFVASVTLVSFVIYVTYANHVMYVTFVDLVYLMKRGNPANIKSE